ncbi:TetR/AcrR family transcriptional regulator [Maritimibacter dapengensis]|uniref:TetR/AcrR family transcriptional regulator n=1 Tax=Maritimibacter dapengensis TaxID=2836868 RepID=A0ABS6T1G1_9RHOB|nr:TetR/AcrR family transcriptional regulator [Maritimibacter dapengensis]MBV7379075.1 TetR/AcrR family transcriptional regulator [Maritimibacter dapengensis]
MNEITKDTQDKSARIIGSAFEAFRLYGVKRVSMADIAQGAGMSRAALYLHFRNKEDIFASLVANYFAQAAEVMEAELAAASTPTEALRAAFRAKVAPPYDQLLESPHGPELLDAKANVNAETIAAGNARLVSVFARWVATGRADGTLSVSTIGDGDEETARVILAAVHGVIEGARSYAGLLDDLDRLALLMGRALAA